MVWTLFFKFRKISKETDRLQTEIQKIEQEMHDMDLSNQISNNQKQVDLAYLKGRTEGVKWCLEKSSFFSH